MDNDELRRGQPTVWKAYDEWTAILAGDALQAIAFELISGPQCHEDPEVRAALVETLAAASGAAGWLVARYSISRRASCRSSAAPTIADVTRLQSMKTGRLITAACEMGAILGKATQCERAAVRTYGEHLGMAFQISDDLLDVEGTTTNVGKATGKDAAAGKATFVGLLGIEAARDHLDRVDNGCNHGACAFGKKPSPLPTPRG